MVIFTGEGAGGAAAMLMESTAISVHPVGEEESCTLTVTGKLPDAVGVPEISPFEASESPPGSAPAASVQR